MASQHDDDSPEGYVPSSPADSKVGVLEWLMALGHAVVRKVKPMPASPMLRIHARR
jgi:hypothetical protein